MTNILLTSILITLWMILYMIRLIGMAYLTHERMKTEMELLKGTTQGAR